MTRVMVVTKLMEIGLDDNPLKCIRAEAHEFSSSSGGVRSALSGPCREVGQDD